MEDRAANGEYQRDAARAFIDNGADLILGHGTLVTKGIEVYNGKVIFYSLGKFLMKGPRPTGDVPIGVNAAVGKDTRKGLRSEEHTSELQSLMRISYAVFCLKKKRITKDILR